MKCANRLGSKWIVFPLVATLAGLFSVAPTEAQLTGPGNNAVYNSGEVLSPSFIDASVFLPPNQGTHAADICDAIYQILIGNPNFLKHGYPPSGAVIDTRGVSGTTNLTCQGSPWTEGSNTVSVPSTILLPAGTIVIPTKWVLPSNTHLIGEGSNISGLFTPGTTLQVSSSFTANTPMIQFGSSSGCCSGISLYSCANTTNCTTDTLYGCQGTNGWHGIQ
jgi:hypothetical protein